MIIGKKGWLYEDIRAPTRFGVSDKVKFLHDVPDGDLRTFIRMPYVLLSRVSMKFGYLCLKQWHIKHRLWRSNQSS